MLTEYLVSIMINMMLAGAGIMLIFTSVQGYIYEIGDWELVSELRTSMENIEQKARYGIKVEGTGDHLVITFQDDNNNKRIVDNYYLKNNFETGATALYHKHNNSINPQPLTGDTLLGHVNMKRAVFSKKSNHTLNVQLEGENTINGHSFSLEADIFCYGELLGSG